MKLNPIIFIAFYGFVCVYWLIAMIFVCVYSISTENTYWLWGIGGVLICFLTLTFFICRRITRRSPASVDVVIRMFALQIILFVLFPVVATQAQFSGRSKSRRNAYMPMRSSSVHILDRSSADTQIRVVPGARAGS